jgi:hypothetical protein
MNEARGEADWEARRRRLEREDEAGRAFGDRLREKLAANSPRVEDLEPRREGGDDAG